MPIMRKDVKLGLAVGGVLLAVLVVYVLVVPGNNANQVGATLENLDGSETQAGDAAAGESVAHGETTTPPADSTGASAQDQQATGAGATADAGGANGASGAGTGAGGAGAGETSAAAGGAGTGSGNTGASAKDNATAGGGWNWDALVNGTEKLPSMGAATDVSTNNANFTNAGGNQAGDGAAGNGGNLPTNIPANGTSTAGGTAGQNGAAGGSLAQGGTAPGGADVLSSGTPGAAGQSPSRQTTLAEATSPRRQDGAPAPTVATDSSARTHVVKVGDTYSKISLAVYGTSKHYADIELANPGVDPTRLKPGTTINLPAVAAKQPSGTPAVSGAAATIDPQKEYKVQPNDSLYTISLRLYGKADRMEKIYELNKSAIGDDMARLKLGMVLKLPEPPTQTTAAAQAR
jgi:nucleoid-associated protein YgaU